MAELFRRTWAISIGALRIAGEGAGGGAERASLDCVFEVEKSTSREPNTAHLQIYNLSRSHRRALEQASSLALRIEAGYVDNHGVIFDGDVRVAASRRRAQEHRPAQSRLGRVGSVGDTVDVTTEIEAEDGGTAWRTATVQRSFSPGAPVAAVLRACVDAMGVGRGNLSELGVDVTLGDVGTYAEGTVLSGPAHRELDRIVRSVGLTWSVQAGNLQLKRAGQALATTAVRLAPETGLIGSPAPDADGYVECVSLLDPGLYPGRPVVLESREVSGSFSVKRVRYQGDTSGGDWYAQSTLEER